MELLDKIFEVLSKPGRKTTGLDVSTIISECSNGELFESDGTDIGDAIKKILASESRKDDGKIERVKRNGRVKTGWFKIRRASVALPSPNRDVDVENTGYIGKGGEYAVMSELLFNGYNANIMAVDEGIDIVASKDNFLYYIQVKTTHLTERHTAIAQIKRASFDRVSINNVRYIVVVRCGKGEIRYFVFNQQNIEMFKEMKCINVTNENIIIKIRFSENDHKPYLYNDKESEASFFQNNFML